jgi:hypothetical protein
MFASSKKHREIEGTSYKVKGAKMLMCENIIKICNHIVQNYGLPWQSCSKCGFLGLLFSCTAITNLKCTD